MGIIFYKKGTNDVVRGIPCTKEIMKSSDFNFKAMEKQGWYLRPEDIPQDVVVKLEEQDKLPDENEPIENFDELKEQAKKAGIKSYWLMSPETLRERLRDAEQHEG